MTDHFEQAARYAERAEDYANRDSVRREDREAMVSYNVRMAQVHATIAVAQRLDTMIGLVFDEGRLIRIADESRPLR